MPVNFDDLTNRILDKMDKLEEGQGKTCDRLSEVENKLDTHLATLDRKSKASEKKFYYIIAIMGIGFATFEILAKLVL